MFHFNFKSPRGANYKKYGTCAHGSVIAGCNCIHFCHSFPVICRIMESSSSLSDGYLQFQRRPASEHLYSEIQDPSAQPLPARNEPRAQPPAAGSHPQAQPPVANDDPRARPPAARSDQRAQPSPVINDPRARPPATHSYVNENPRVRTGKPWWKNPQLILVITGFVAGLAMLIYIMARIEQLNDVSSTCTIAELSV